MEVAHLLVALPDSAPETHPKVQQLREQTQWAECMMPYLVDRYSERKLSAEELSKRANQQST